MPNPNYKAGRRFEYERKAYWENLGYTVLRTAGSHGFADLVLVSPCGSVIFSQCKLVSKRAAAIRLCNDFLQNPPIELGDYCQILECRARGDRDDIVTVWVGRKGD